MKYLVTGGAGFIGSHLVDRLINEGHEVVIIDNLSTGKKEYINPQAKFYEIDIRDESLKDIFDKERPDYVFHLAAQADVRVSVAEPVKDNEINVLGSLNVFNNAFSHKVKKIIFFSTGGAIYGNVSEPAHEECLPNPDSPYAVHKYTSERLLDIFSKMHNVNYAILRPANVYGPRQYKGGDGAAIATFTYNILNDIENKIYGNGLQTRDFIYVEDIVDLAYKAIHSEKNGVFNAGTGEKANILDVINMVGQVAGKEVKYQFHPPRPGEVRDSVLDASKARQELNWEHKHNLEEGLKKTFAWLKNK